MWWFRFGSINTVFGLKLIWLLFAWSGSLWVSWVHKMLIRGRFFWDANFQNCGSWIWRHLTKLRSLARPFLACHYRREYCFVLAYSLGQCWPLIGITGPLGPKWLVLPYSLLFSKWWQMDIGIFHGVDIKSSLFLRYLNLSRRILRLQTSICGETPHLNQLQVLILPRLGSSPILLMLQFIGTKSFSFLNEFQSMLSFSRWCFGKG